VQYGSTHQHLPLCVTMGGCLEECVFCVRGAEGVVVRGRSRLNKSDPLRITEQGLLQDRRQTMLGRRAMPIGHAATSFVDQWTHLASPDFQSPMEVLSARAAGVPVIYPSIVIDKSGALKRDLAPQVRS